MDQWKDGTLMKYFTAIGSRNISEEYARRMAKICAILCMRGYCLRSGGADGSDKYAEMGCDEVCGNKEIYLPFEGFNEHTSFLYLSNRNYFTEENERQAFSLAEEIHPAWDKCSKIVRKLHARNTAQILGYDMKTPSDFVVCYTDDGTAKGGTATAMNLAKRLGIPIYNLYHDNIEKFVEFL